jgi:hypothetical protein
VKGKTDSIVIDTTSKAAVKLVIDTVSFDPNIDLAEQLMPIDSILDYAVKIHPRLKWLRLKKIDLSLIQNTLALFG